MVKNGQSCAVLPREVIFSSIGIESVIFETISPERIRKPNVLKVALRAIRPASLTLSLGPAGAVLCQGLFFQHWLPSWPDFFLALLGTVFLQIAVNLLNDVEDHLRLVDRPGALGGSGVIQRGWLSARDLKRAGYFSLALSVLCGAPIIITHFWHSWLLLVVGILGTVGALVYSTGPFAMKYRAFGDGAVFFLAGPLLVMGYSEATFGKWSATDLWLSLFFGWIAWATVHSKHIQSFEMDKKSRVVTFPIRVGFKKSRPILAGLYILAYLSVLVGVGLKVIPIGVLFAVILAWPLVYKQIARVYQASLTF